MILLVAIMVLIAFANSVFKYDLDPKLICVDTDTILMIRFCVMSIIDTSCNSSVQYNKLIM